MINKYKENIAYLIFGVLTTVINFVTYFILTETAGINTVTSNIIATTVSILFAYITNKLFVFDSKTTSTSELIEEFFRFIGARVVTGILDTIFVYIGVEMLYTNNKLVKTISCIIVIILNYVMSKLVVFNKQ